MDDIIVYEKSERIITVIQESANNSENMVAHKVNIWKLTALQLTRNGEVEFVT